MNTTTLGIVWALASASAIPLAASAQQSPSPPPVTASGTVTGPNVHQGSGGGILAALKNIDLSPDQRTQIHAIVTQFRQAHPEGSAPDPAGRKAMRQQVMGLLTPTQQAQFKQEMRAQNHAPQDEPNDTGSAPP